ncbi:MAG: MBL fold metallo-hydrolase [Promethearchaeia archaeon]
MTIEEFNYGKENVKIERIEDLESSYKIPSYKKKLKYMENKEIPRQPIEDVIQHFFHVNDYIEKKVKKSISKILYAPEDRIIIVLTNQGRPIIWKRTKLVKEYGWFFFVERPEQKGKSKSSGGLEDEVMVSEDEFTFNELTIPVVEKKNMRSLYHTKEYFKYRNIIKSHHVPQMPIKKLLHDFFFKNKLVPLVEKKAIRKILYYKKERVIVVKSLIGDEMYKHLKKLVKRYGWYFYITGVPVGSSDVCTAIDKIEKRYDAHSFDDVSILHEGQKIEDVQISLFPVKLKPDQNCLVLSIGKFNIILECGISKEDIEVFHKYLDKKDDLIKTELNRLEKIKKTKSQKKAKDEKAPLKEIQNLMDFDEDVTDSHEKSKEASTSKEVKDLNGKKGEIPQIDAIFLSHSHFDHISGLNELIKKFPDLPIFCSRITLDLYILRDSDFLKQDSQEEIEQEEYRNVVKNVIYVENGEKIEFKERDCYLAFYHAGHMPGALMLLSKLRGFRFLFTGDYTYWDYSPFAGTRRFLDQISRPIDFLLIDGTCANEEFDNFSQQLKTLLLFLEQKAEYGDDCLIGADPSSLAITLMLKIWRYFRKKQLRHDYKKRPNIYVDKIVRKNIQVINHRYQYIYGPISKLIRDKANPFNSIKFRWFDHDNLDFLDKKNNIIISHPPDLSYGIIRNIISRIGRKPHNLVYLTGAIREKPGADLINGSGKKKETKLIEFTDSWKVPMRALFLNNFATNLKIKLHGDKIQLKEMINHLEPKEVCFFHQNPSKLVSIAKEIKKMDIKRVSVPEEQKLMILNQEY